MIQLRGEQSIGVVDDCNAENNMYIKLLIFHSELFSKIFLQAVQGKNGHFDEAPVGVT